MSEQDGKEERANERCQALYRVTSILILVILKADHRHCHVYAAVSLFTRENIAARAIFMNNRENDILCSSRARNRSELAIGSPREFSGFLFTVAPIMHIP